MHAWAEKAYQIAQGTCKTVDDIAQELTSLMGEEISPDDVGESLEEQELFLCTTCGWWCESSELAESDDGEHTCEDCA